MSKNFLKDPDAVLDYAVDWSDFLSATDPSDTITESSWTSDDSGITIDSDSSTDTEAKVWLSGGTVGKRYALTNHILTAGGREDDRTIYIRVRQK